MRMGEMEREEGEGGDRKREGKVGAVQIHG